MVIQREWRGGGVCAAFAIMKLRGCMLLDWHQLYPMKGFSFRMELWNVYHFNI